MISSHGSQSSPSFPFEFTQSSFDDFNPPPFDDFGFSDAFTTPRRWGPMTFLHLEDVGALEPQPTPSPGADLVSLCSEVIEGDHIPALFHENLLKYLRPYIIEYGPDETSEAVKELIDPTSRVTMLKLTSYLTLLLSNDLVSDLGIFILITEVKMLQFKFFKWIFNQATPSARAAAGRLLHGAVERNAIAFVSEALKSGADVESPSTQKGSFTLLQSALSFANTDIAELLLRYGANVNVATTAPPSGSPCSGSEAHASGFTCQCQMIGKHSPVALAAKSRTCVNLIPKLLDCGTTLPMCNVLLTAIVHGASFDTVRRLISEGADPNQCNIQNRSDEMTPLSAAAARCNVEIVDLILKANANPNGPLRADLSHLYMRYYGGEWKSPLMSALCASSYQTEGPCDDIVALLLKHGADLNLSPLEFLTSSVDADICAEPDTIFGVDRDSPHLLYPLQAASRGQSLEIVSMLLDSGASINTQYGTPALTVAILNSRVETARFLLSAGADSNAFGRHSSCPLALEAAVIKPNLEMVDLLLASGADLNKCPAIDGGRTCLQRAAENGNMDIFDHLVKLGARVLSDVAPTGGISVLQGLIENGNHEYVSWALKAGVSPNQCSMESRTPLNAAVVNKDRKSLRLLLEAGSDVHEYGPVVDDFLVSSEDESSGDFLGQSNCFDHTQILSPIQWASYMNSVKVARVLFDAGADVNQESNSDSGNMALYLAADRGNYAMVKFLVRRGASVNVFPMGTPHFALP
jgi:ankyrin repeat protein